MLNFDKPAAQNLVKVPAELMDLEDYKGPIYGYIREDSGVHVILGWKGNEPLEALNTSKIGKIGKEVTEGIFGIRNNGKLEFILRMPDKADVPLGVDCDAYGNKGFTLIQNVFSRQKGLIETEYMLNKTVVIAGCGSVGSAMALQLARAGVGRFFLADTDVVDIHNICRHQCNITDIGDYKVYALKKRIQQINPYADIKATPKLIQDSEHELTGYLGKDAVIIGAGDNRLSAAVCNDIAIEHGIPFISLGFWTRACVGEIFTWLPDQEQVCYRCALHEAVENSMKVMNRNYFYIGEEAAEKASFEPGLGIDVEFGSTIASKIVIDMLNRNNSEYIPRVIHTLTQYTWVCNTNEEAIGGVSATMFPYPLDIARNIVFDESIECNHKHV